MHLTAAKPSTPHRPWFRLLAVAVGVAALHLALWQGVADSFAADTAPDRVLPALQVRTVMPPAPTDVQPVAEVIVAKPSPPPLRAPAAVPAAVIEPEQAPPATLPEPPAEPALVAAVLPAQSSLEPTLVATAADDVPVYPTRMPPAMTLHYDMRRGAISGTGDLQWRPTAKGYQARLEGRVAGFSILTWASQGNFDAAGIAPTRFTDQRRGKSEQAANFQRGAGKISYSGPSTEYPLMDGAQDRLSWMIQVAAIAQADPKRLAPGKRVAMFVTGARGDGDVWSFLVQGVEDVSTGSGNLRAIKLLREPRKPHDTRVEVWLAPSLHHLPVRARLSSDDSALDLQLQTAQPAS
jgi:hypothetical protein